MNRRDLLSASGALAAAALAGCLGDGGDGVDSTPLPTTAGPGGGTSGPVDVDEARLAALAADNAAFALDLHRRLATGADDSGGDGGGGGGGDVSDDVDAGNLFLSPYSVSVALAMTYAGARGRTREQMAETLYYGLGADVHPAFADLRAVLATRASATDPVDGDEVDAFQLSVANALWGREGYPFAGEYLALVADNYGTGLRRADFAGDPEGARTRINEWVAGQTADRIEELLPPTALSPDTVLVLTNAIYFMAGWLQQFDPEDTAEETFTTLGGSETAVPFMHQHVRAPHASVDGAQAVELPYVGEEVSMVLLLPGDGTFEAFERDLDADRLFRVFDSLGDAAGTIALPRFEFGSTVQLSDVLKSMGMTDAFGSGADFGGMVAGDGGGPFISEVYHETFVSVDEEGTEASAATAVVMDESAPPEWGTIRFDRPFLFCIRDRPTNAVLFLGRVVDAGAAQGQQ